MSSSATADGVHAMAPREKMTASARKLRDTYAVTPGAPLFRREFGFMAGTLERWVAEGHLPGKFDRADVFLLDPPGNHVLYELGWCEAAFRPAYEVKVLQDRGEHELVQDVAGRHVLCFKGRRDGFMPEYVDHPVKDEATWERDVKRRLDPNTSARYEALDERMRKAKADAAKGLMISQGLIGGYMYLRSLIGPETLLYFFYDRPGLLHDCMRTWFELADAVIARHQAHVTLDEVYFAEDICYNRGPLISPDMMHEFILPYYARLIANVRGRQIDRTRRLHVHVDTDGWAVPVIDLYREVGLTTMSPFEAASGCDVVKIGKEHPDLAIFGGIDKRVLARSLKDIDRHLEYILPAMRRRGGYIPTCDHAVPAEVPFENYMHYRRRCVELGG